MPDLIQIEEPGLLFAKGQIVEDPRDGLSLFGPLDEGKVLGVRVGVVGTRQSILRLKKWMKTLQRPIANDPPSQARPPFPGFEEAFRVPWNPEPIHEVEMAERDLEHHIHIKDKYHRVYDTVSLYAEPILKTLDEEEANVDVWFVPVPDELYKYCRPQSAVELHLQTSKVRQISSKHARKLYGKQILFPEFRNEIRPYEFEPNFRHQLKARLLKHLAPTQIVRESTIAYQEVTDAAGKPLRDLEKMQSSIAWNIATAAFYKAGGRPWKIGHIREGVCYIGLAFKKDGRSVDPKAACCAAQMFLDSGDGVVFKGAAGPWYAPKRGEFHLSYDAAKEVIRQALTAYRTEKGTSPRELFLHGKVRFNAEEWQGFEAGADPSANLVGVQIRPTTEIKLYKPTRTAILRGLAWVQSDRIAYLWTKGFIPRLNTYPGLEVPKPLRVEICRGEADIQVVLRDIMVLTKLNYNACVFADGQPVTLKFADAVGEILTAAPIKETPPLPFKHYI